MKKYILIIFLLTGCVYFNTFYNAKEYYEKAIESTTPNHNLLDKSIQKCEKIIKYHPTSKYVPDAIFLIGKCFLEKEEYEHAMCKFKELITYYPEHSLADKSQLELGRVYLRRGDYSDARYALLEVKENKKLANKLIIDSYFFEGDYENFISFAKGFIDSFPKSKLKVDMLTKIGNSCDSLEKFEDALGYYKKALKLTTQRFNISLSIARSLIALNQYEEALQKLISLRETVEADKKAELELAISKCYRAKGEIEKAIEVLEEFENSPPALYELGTIYEEKLSDLGKAKEYYELARNLWGSSGEKTKQAIDKSSRIEKLTKYIKIIEEQDSMKVDDIDKIHFLLAELYWQEFDTTDTAIEEYEKIIQNFPESKYAAKSAYSIAWLTEYKKENTEKAILAYERTRNDFRGTEHAQFSYKALLRLIGDTLTPTMWDTMEIIVEEVKIDTTEEVADTIEALTDTIETVIDTTKEIVDTLKAPIDTTEVMDTIEMPIDTTTIDTIAIMDTTLKVDTTEVIDAAGVPIDTMETPIDTIAIMDTATMIVDTVEAAAKIPAKEVLAEFKVQLEAFKIEKNANRLYESLKKKDIYIENIPPYWKVRIGQYNTYEEALDARDKWRDKGYEDAWIIPKNHNESNKE